MSLTHQQQKDLVGLLENLNVEMFKAIGFQYGIDVANLGATGPKAMARELVLHAVRHIEVPKLLAAIHAVIPKMDLTPFGGPAPETTAVSPTTTKPPTQVTAVPTDPTQSPPDKPDYVNFDIRIGEKRDEDGRYPVTARSDQGYGETDSSTWQALPDDVEFEEALDYLRERIARPSDAETLGQKLHHFLFPIRVLNLYNLSRAKAKAEDKTGLRIRLRIDRNAPELSKIPWEYCFGDKGFLALNEETPFVRYIETTELPEPITTPEKVRILIVMASPSDWPKLDTAAEEKWINKALTNLKEKGRVEVKVLTQATRSSLRRQFRRYEPHIFHFVGHGKLMDDGEGALILENNDGTASTVSAKDMHLLLQSSDIKLVVLSACQTADHGTSDAIMGVAPRLIWAGVPAAVAMQFKIPDKTAISFTRDLYEFLADGDPLDSAVTEARLGAYFDNDDKVFWAIPVLFMRSPDGVIWQ